MSIGFLVEEDAPIIWSGPMVRSGSGVGRCASRHPDVQAYVPLLGILD
jgi:hypothetical protein